MTEFVSQSQSFSSPTTPGPDAEKRATTRAAGIVGVWTFLSRIMGFARDLVIALFLGAGTGADAFFVGFRIPNLLRRLFGEGALSAAFIPTYVETLKKDGLPEGERLARIAFTFTAILLAFVTLAGILLSPWIVRVIAPGFLDYPEKFGLTVELNRMMFPYIFFISLVALASGVLNSMGRFAAPAAAPIVLNVSMITSVVVLCAPFGIPPYYALAWGVVAAGILQLALQIPFMTAAGVSLRPNFDFRHPALRKIAILFVPAALGGAVYQINVMIGTILASMCPQGSVSYLYYADRLVELPLGVFAIALGTAVLPSMSRQAADGDIPALTRTVSFSLRLIAFFTIPASIALILLREPIVAMLFQRGKFSYLVTQQTAYALLWYTVGLWAFSGLKVVTQAFFSLKDTKTPFYVAIGTVILNLVAGLLLMGPMLHGGLALATSAAAAFNVLVLFAILVRRLGKFPMSELGKSLGRTTAASLPMAALLVYLRPLGDWSQGLNAHNFILLLGCLFGGLAVFAAASYVLKSPEIKSLLSLAFTSAVAHSKEPVMSRTIELPWGTDILKVRLPETWRVLGELRPKGAEAAPRAALACEEALADPIGAQPLSSRDWSGHRVALVVDDHSRPTPVREFIHPVLAQLASAGVKDEDIRILIATGVHRSSRPEEVERKLGRDVMDRFQWQCHDAYDPTGLSDLGTTSRGTRVFLNKLLLEADLIVCLGALEPHLLLGFGGGLKMIMPGCSGALTIGKNHMQGVDPDHFDYVGVHGNDSPMRLDLEEGVGFLDREIFIVNAAMNERGQPTRFFCGDPIRAHRAGEAFVESMVRLEVPEHADVVLTNSFPMDLDLRQLVKCLGNSLHACKPGGMMMGCVRCEAGLGEMPIARKTLPYPVMRGLLKLIGKQRILSLVEKAKKGEPVEEIFIGHFGLQMLRRNHLAIFSDSATLPPDIGRKMGLCRSFSDVQDMIAWAVPRVPKNATVWVFPCGGTTYAQTQSNAD